MKHTPGILTITSNIFLFTIYYLLLESAHAIQEGSKNVRVPLNKKKWHPKTRRRRIDLSESVRNNHTILPALHALKHIHHAVKRIVNWTITGKQVGK